MATKVWRNNGGRIEALTAGRMGDVATDPVMTHVVAIVGTVNEQTPEDTANARLIAAAPYLLEAAIELLDRLENITTDEFAAGGEHYERAKLLTAIRQALAE